MHPQPISFVRRNYVQAKARLLLSEFGFHSPPVDVEAILEKRGARVRYYMSDDGPPGITFDIDGQLVVAIQLGVAGRMQWSMAHELGHIELGHIRLNIDGLYEDRLTERERYILDREADLFARDLLMPAKWVRAAVSGAVNVNMINRLAKEFGVSSQAMSIRLAELGFLSREIPSRSFVTDDELFLVASVIET